MASSFAFQTLLGGAGSLWSAPEPIDFGLAWLGQAGFALRFGGTRLLIDPYLSDHLERKYRGSERPHDRMMPSAGVEAFDGVDFVLCTHQHGDHMDPEALPALAVRNPACRFVVPRASLERARGFGVPIAQLVGIDAGEAVTLNETLSLEAIPAAHETLERNERGEHRFLGLILRAGAFAGDHSGDSVPYPDLKRFLTDHSIGLALLPVNGRGKGVAGNFTFQEATELCRAVSIPYMVPHHFGMFAFNTVDRSEVASLAKAMDTPRCLLPEAGQCLLLSPRHSLV